MRPETFHMPNPHDEASGFLGKNIWNTQLSLCVRFTHTKNSGLSRQLSTSGLEYINLTAA